MQKSLSQQLPHVYRLALRLCRDQTLAEDLTQETMLKAIRKIDQLESPERLRVWLLQILSNTWRDHVRKPGSRRTQTLDQEPVEQTTAPSEISEQRDELQLALDAMNALPEKQRAVLHLFAVEELSLAEIGEILDMKPNTAKVNLFHARQAMRRKLPEMAGEKTNQAEVSK
ncbi:MAG: RNA polymerase sigma factor [Planctomycetaceae bacterium]